MEAEIHEQGLERVQSELDARGLTYRHLRDDILDHVCCAIEEDLARGYGFDEAFDRVWSELEDDTLSGLQHEILCLLNKKHQIMKKGMYFIGIAGSLFILTGLLFKTLHLPGASIVLLLGFLLVVAGFLPLYFILSYREQTEKSSPFFPFITWFSLFLVSAAAVFKIMHWPGTALLQVAAVLVLLLGFLPVYMVRIFRRGNLKGSKLAYFVMLLTGISIAAMVFRTNLSYDAVNIYTKISERNEAASAKLAEACALHGQVPADSAAMNRIASIRQQGMELEMLADSMLWGLQVKAGGEGMAPGQIPRRDIRNASASAFIRNGMAQRYKAGVRAYHEFLHAAVSDELVRMQIDRELQFATEIPLEGWMVEKDRYTPMIAVYARISGYKRSVNYSCYLAVEELSR
jgi:hypothetical protein